MRLLLFVVILTLIAIPLFVHAQSTGYIMLSADPDNLVWCVRGAGFYPIELWIWCYPNEDGHISAEFSINYPSNVIQSTVTIDNTIVSASEGNLANGIQVSYFGCQTGFNSPLRQQLYVTDQTPTHIEIANHPDIGTTRFATCEEGNSYYICCRCFFYVNYVDGQDGCGY